jgi:uncharacterized protein YndB with AHSA1/START domain/DNA-binding transcriptional ArsR family regulator
MDDVFKALADPSRRELLDGLNERNGQTLRELSAGLKMARQSVSKHLAILEAANLVTTIWHGREKLHYLNADPINAISERWIKHYERERIGAIADLKQALESRTVNRNTASDSEFVYTTYIEAPPELVWRGLTDPTFTRRYWGMEFHTDWKVGSPISVFHNRSGVTVADAAMVVKESVPFTRLSFGWEAHPEELFGKEHADHAATEPRSTVTYELLAQGTQTKLTIIHTGFEPGSVVLPDISEGWPKVAAWLKTFLESGKYEQAE